MSLGYIKEHPGFDNTSNIGHELRRIWNSVKRDISRIVSLSKDDNQIDSHQEIKQLRSKIEQNLRQVTEIRTTQKNISDEWWNQILHRALLQTCKYRDDAKFHKDLQRLIAIDRDDMSLSAISFIQAYMLKIARISKNRIIIPFKPHK